LRETVAPSVIVVQNGRSMYDNPRQPVINGYRDTPESGPYIACGQLNPDCCAQATGPKCAGNVYVFHDSGIVRFEEQDHEATVGLLGSPRCQAAPVAVGIGRRSTAS